MEWLTNMRLRILALVRRRRLDRDLEEEMRFHLEMREAAMREEGVDPDEARDATRRRFGNRTALLETCRALWTFTTLETLAQDVRFGLRLLAKKPGYTAAAVVTLALGIGANTTIFGVVNAIMFKPIPFREPDRLALVLETSVDDPKNVNLVSAPNFLDWRRESDAFDGMALFDAGGRGFNLSGGGEPERASGLRVTPGFFDVLGVRPRLGRAFVADDEAAAASREVILSDGLWRGRYGADPDVVGRTIVVDGEGLTIVGVMPPDFEFQFWSAPQQLFVPMTYTESDHGRDSHSFAVLARLRPGVSFEQAGERMDAVGRGLSELYPKENAGETVAVVPLSEFGQENYRATWLALLAVAGFVLFIACVNVANLVLARGAAREWELAVRSALGASRWRTARQLLTESLLTAFAGGAVGVLVAVWSGRALESFLPDDVRSVPFRALGGVTTDVRVLAFAWGITCLTGILFGLAPALLLSRRGPAGSLQEGARGSSRGPGVGLRQALVVAEVALALVVLTGAGLMIESMKRLLDVPPGLDPTNVLTMGVSLPQENLYVGPPGHPRFAHDLRERVGAMPGVVSVSAVSHLPLGGGSAGRGYTVEGRPAPAPDEAPGASYAVACPDFFRTMGIPLVAGREFAEADSLEAPQVVVINEAMARETWPNEEPIGRRIKIGGVESDAPWMTIVGVVRDVRQRGLDRDVPALFYRPYSQAAWPNMTIVVRVAADPASYAEPVKRAIAEIEPDRPVSGERTMEQVVRESVGSRRFPTLLLVAFSVLALALAAVGIFGVVGFAVAQRTREIGIRLALGAGRRDVLALVLRRSLGAALLGIAIGLAGSFALSRFLTGLLYGVRPTDPYVLAAVSAILAGVAFLASYLPARRATKIDPVTALRYE